MMKDTVSPKTTNIMHVAFPISKQAVRSFRGELEDNIEFITKPHGPSRLRDLLFPGSSKFNTMSMFPMPRGFEQPLIVRGGKMIRKNALHLEDFVSSPVNAEANPGPSPIPIQETPTIKKDHKEYRVRDPLDNFGSDQEGVFMHPRAGRYGTSLSSGGYNVKDRVPPSPILSKGGNYVQANTQAPFSYPTLENAGKLNFQEQQQKKLAQQFKDTEKKLKDGEKAAAELADAVRVQKNY